MNARQELEQTRAWVHKVVDLCQDVDTLDLAGKIMVSEENVSKATRPAGGGIVTPLLFGQRVAAR